MKFVTQHLDSEKKTAFVNLDMAIEVGYKIDLSTGHLTAFISAGDDSPSTKYPTVKVDLETDPIGEKLKGYIDELPATGAYIKVGENQYVRKNSIRWVYWTPGTDPIQNFVVYLTCGGHFVNLSEDGAKSIVNFLITVGEKEGWVKKNEAEYINMNLVGVGTLEDNGFSPWVASIGFSDHINNHESVKKIVESRLFK